MKSKITERSEINVAGILCKVSVNDNEKIHKVIKTWNDFNRRIGELQSDDVTSYGVLSFPEDFNPDTSEFTYLACKEVSSAFETPKDMFSDVIPAGKYCVITYIGPFAEIDSAYEYFNNTWLPQSDFSYREGIEFEIYGERFIGFDNNDSEIDIYFPIR